MMARAAKIWMQDGEDFGQAQTCAQMVDGGVS